MAQLHAWGPGGGGQSVELADFDSMTKQNEHTMIAVVPIGPMHG